jgi:hypothetical protein
MDVAAAARDAGSVGFSGGDSGTAHSFSSKTSDDRRVVPSPEIGTSWMDAFRFRD